MHLYSISPESQEWAYVVYSGVGFTNVSLRFKVQYTIVLALRWIEASCFTQLWFIKIMMAMRSVQS